MIYYRHTKHVNRNDWLRSSSAMQPVSRVADSVDTGALRPIPSIEYPPTASESGPMSGFKSPVTQQKRNASSGKGWGRAVIQDNDTSVLISEKAKTKWTMQINYSDHFRRCSNSRPTVKECGAVLEYMFCIWSHSGEVSMLFSLLFLYSIFKCALCNSGALP